MQQVNEVLTLPSVGNRRSYLTAPSLAGRRDWADCDLVWLAEDDYLYRTEAFAALLASARALPDADHFALYASVGERSPEAGTLPAYAPVPTGWANLPSLTVEGVSWAWALSHTATYGARVASLSRPSVAASLCTASA